MERNSAVSLSSAAVALSRAIVFWKIIQILFWFIGIGLLLCMLFLPTLGVTLFWNILIPVAPVLLVIATGVWRNICPLATTALLPDRFGFSKKIKLSASMRNRFNMIGVIALLLIIPLRHVLFNTNGQATAYVIIGVAAVAFATGLIFERKSAWCSGLCPVHPVEKLYGSGVAFSLPNAHCKECVKCSVPCPDSTANMNPVTRSRSTSSKLAEVLLVGVFPGYVWGWFQLPDYEGAAAWDNLLMVYGYPVMGGMVTLILYLFLKKIFANNKRTVINLFAAAAVSCYYWFRLPQLLGFSSLDTNGVLIDLTAYLPAWSMILLNLVTTVFFVWWLVIRNKALRSWSVRPAYAINPSLSRKNY
jgi:hypothetical protein